MINKFFKVKSTYAKASVDKSGSSSIGRAIAFQAIGREFDPRLPLATVWSLGFGVWSSTPNTKLQTPNQVSRRSSGVEHFLGREEVMGSIPIDGS
jgi:hypothetical protein